MLVKKTLKNQITLPKQVLKGFLETDYFDIKVCGDEIVLKPVKIMPVGSTLEGVRKKISSLGLSEKDIEEAVRCARKEQSRS